jgi:diguanylate cyclase (GGDEF)-like protein/PAS domain S-box-containing protein
MVAFFSILSIVASTVSFFVGSLIFFKNRRGYPNIVFLLLCYVVAYWGFMEFLIRTAESFDAANIRLHLNFVWPFSTALMLHFSLTFTRRTKLLGQPLTFVILYVPAILISSAFLFTDYLSSTPVHEKWGWTYMAPNTIINYLAVGWVSSMGLLSVLFCLLYYLKLRNRAEKTQAGYVVLGLSIPMLIGSITDALLPAMDIRIPELAVVSFATGVAGFIGIAIWKYELFELTPEKAADKILTTMSDSLLLVDPDCKITSANRATKDLLGYSMDQLLGHDVNMIISTPDEYNQCLRLLKDDSVTGVKRMDMSWRTKNGEMIPVSLSLSKLTDIDRNLRGFICEARDISERRRAELVLQESELRHRLLFEMSPDGIMMLDLKGNILMCNSQVYATHGFHSPEELVGKNGAEFLLPEDRQRMVADLKDLVEHPGELGEGPVVEYELLRAGGGTWPASIKGSVMRDAAGEPTGVMLIMRDMTATRHADAALRESETRYGELIDLSPDEITVIDLEGNFLILNQRAVDMHGFDSVKEMMKVKYLDLIAPEDRQRAKDAIQGIIQAGGVKTDEFTFLKKSGSRFPTEVSATLIRDGNQPRAIIGVIRDISERKSNELQITSQREELAERNSELEALYKVSQAVATAQSTEELISSILNSITGLAELFQAQPKAGIFLIEDGGMRLAGHVGEHSKFFLGLHDDLKVGDCLCGLAAQSGEIIISENSDTDHRHRIHDSDQGEHGHVIVPLNTSNRTLGVLYLYLPANTVSISERRLMLLESIGNRIAIAIDNVKLHEQTKELSLHDPLTGLANRRLMSIELRKNLARARRSGQPCSLIMLDLDYFKNYNDLYGHTSGDRLLVEIACLIGREIREVDLAVRYGGEEFLLILPDTDAEEAREVAERIRAKTDASAFKCSDSMTTTDISVSLGVATWEENVASEDILIARADTALYRAKANGRNRVETWISSAPKTGADAV